jgi:NitT/TauT family transport system substrate-binding protein
MRKILYALIVTLYCSLSFNSYAGELQTIKIAQFGKEKFLLYLPLYVADEEGYMAQNGLKAAYIFAGNDDQIFATVISGDADFGVGDPVFTAIAAEKGLKAKTVALTITNLGLSGYTNKDSVPYITDAKDLAGLRVGSFPAPSTTYTLLNELKTKHTELSNMEIVEGVMGTQAAMLEAGKLDIAIDLEPAVSIAENKGYRVVFPMTPFIDRQAITGVMVTEDTIQQRPEIVQAMVTSLQQAIDAMYKDPEVAYRTASKLFPDLSKGVIHKAVDRMLANAMYPRSVVVKHKLWQRTLKTRLDSGELKVSQKTSQAVDNQFAHKAWQQVNVKK